MLKQIYLYTVEGITQHRPNKLTNFVHILQATLQCKKRLEEVVVDLTSSKIHCRRLGQDFVRVTELEYLNRVRPLMKDYPQKKP